MAVQMLGIKTKFTDDQGRPLVGGKVHAYFAGTTTYQDTFKDPDMTIVNTNPIILDDSGSADVYLNGSYRIRIFDKNDVLIEEQDGVTQSASGEITTAKGEIISLYGAVLNSLTNEVKRAVAAEKTIADSLTSETTRAKSAESALQSSIDAEAVRAKAAESDLNANIIKEVSDRESEVTRLDEADAVLQAQINSVGGGKLAYKTYAEMVADKANIPANSSIDVTNDGSNSGTYTYDGAIFTKSTYDPQAIILSKVVSVFPSKATLDASTLPDDSFAAVSDDVDLNKNGYYQKRLGVWVYLRGNTNLQRTSSTKNLLNPSDVTLNIEVRSDGTTLPHGGGAITGLIYCFNKNSLYVSGLQSNAEPRWYRFLNQNNELIESGFLNNNISEKFIPVPDGAYSFQLTLKRANTNPLDLSTAQIEYGTEKTAYVAFEAGAVSHINNNAIAATSLKLNSVGAGKNLFNKAECLVGYEVYNDGRILAQATSIASPKMLVRGLNNVAISGLVANPVVLRYYRFLDASDAIVGTGGIAQESTGATIAVPSNASYFQFSVKQRSTSNPDLDIIQVESGTVATSYEPYISGFSELNGVPVVAVRNNVSSQLSQSRAYGAKYLLFGDSITQTADVDNGDITGTTYRSNWPKFAKDQLKMSSFKNYARSGASFIDTGSSQALFQKIHHQVQTAIDNNETPDVIVLACGTNDANIKLGTYETAMSKSIAELDKTYTAESMRWSLYKIREAFPNAVCFYCTQLQRADVEPTEREAANNLMVKLAKRYGFNIIDCMNDSGIVKDFEVWQANGRHLSDGLHTNIAGQQVQANLIVSEIVSRMSY